VLVSFFLVQILVLVSYRDLKTLVDKFEFFIVFYSHRNEWSSFSCWRHCHNDKKNFKNTI